MGVGWGWGWGGEWGWGGGVGSWKEEVISSSSILLQSTVSLKTTVAQLLRLRPDESIPVSFRLGG